MVHIVRIHNWFSVDVDRPTDRTNCRYSHGFEGYASAKVKSSKIPVKFFLFQSFSSLSWSSFIQIFFVGSLFSSIRSLKALRGPFSLSLSLSFSWTKWFSIRDKNGENALKLNIRKRWTEKKSLLPQACNYYFHYGMSLFFVFKISVALWCSSEILYNDEQSIACCPSI